MSEKDNKELIATITEENVVTPSNKELETLQEEVISTPKVDEEGKVDEFPSLNSNETKELTKEEKHKIFIQQLKDSKIRFNPIKHSGNITTNQFGVIYRKERKRKNKQQKKSRKANR